MKLQQSTALDTFLDWTPVIVSSATAVGMKFAGTDWQTSLIAANVGILAAGIIRLQSGSRKMQKEVSLLIEGIRATTNGTDEVRRSFDRLLQAVVFAPNGIDDSLWLAVGALLKRDANQQIEEALRKVAEVLLKGTLSTRDGHYDYMQAIFGHVSEYRAVCFSNEIGLDRTSKKGSKINSRNIDANAAHFIFEAPLSGSANGKKVFRLFKLNSRDDLLLLPPELKAQLRRQITSPNIELKWRTNSHPSLANLGVYGSVAVGRYKDETNVIDFEKQRVESAMKQWQDVWEAQGTQAITVDMLQ